MPQLFNKIRYQEPKNLYHSYYPQTKSILKPLNKVSMKRTLPQIALLLALTCQVNAQTSVVEGITAHPRLISASTQNKTYRFESLRKISADKEDRIADRLRQSFNGIDSIQIRNQHVTLSVNNDITDQTLTALFKLFGYNTYKFETKK